MTKKENLYFELLKIKNEVSMKKYNHPFKAENLEELVNTPKFRKEANYITIAKVEEEMKAWQEELEKIKKEEAVAQWLETEAGKTYIKEREDKLEELRKDSLKKINEGRIYASAQIKKLLGDQWDVTSFCEGYMEVSIVEKYREDGMPVGLFGHDFEVYFRRDWRYKDGKSEFFFRWEMNYGTMGSFNLESDNNTRAEFLVGMGKFVSDTEIVPELKKYLHTMGVSIYKNDKAGWNLENEIKNPKPQEVA